MSTDRSTTPFSPCAQPEILAQQGATAIAPVVRRFARAAGENVAHDTEEHARHVGHGRRLGDAIEELEALPALAQSRSRALALVAHDRGCAHEIVAAAESDPALTIAVMRVANGGAGGARGGVASVVEAVDLLSAEAVQGIIARARTFDFFGKTSAWDAVAERSRRHAIATQRAAGVIAAEIGYRNRDRLMVTSLLHDVGALVLTRAYRGYPASVHQDARTPEQRVHRERAVLGVDHALVGGVLARRWGLPALVASTIERHHVADAAGEAAIVRLADMLAHYQHGKPTSLGEMLDVAGTLGLDRARLRCVMYDLPTGGFVRGRFPESCPLSPRERAILEHLADGKVSGAIAHELTLAVSTVRTHLHNIYRKLGVADRANAVLHAAEHGWV